MDCLCKKGDGKKRRVFIPANGEEDKDEKLISDTETTTPSPDVIVQKEDNDEQLVETPKKG